MFTFQTSLWSVGILISNGGGHLTCGRWSAESQAESRRQLDISGEDAGDLGPTSRWESTMMDSWRLIHTWRSTTLRGGLQSAHHQSTLTYLQQPPR